MQFYQSIGPWYDLIFPFKKMQKDFVCNFIPDQANNILDIGCATGKLALSLATDQRHITGIDSDHYMITQADQEANKTKKNTEFITGDMMDTDKLFTKASLDAIICLGNTLVHLQSNQTVESFLQQCFDVLKPNGILIIQIINYDRIIDQKIDHLPTIETDNICFKRLYHETPEDTHIRFHTFLETKKSKRVIENDIPLLAIRKARLEKIINNVGFSQTHCFGSFAQEPWTPNSSPSIFVIKK